MTADDRSRGRMPGEPTGTPEAFGARIAFLVWRDTGHPEGGGSEVFVESVATGLARAGHDVEVWCAGYPGAPRVEIRDGVRFRRRGGRLTVYLFALLRLLRRGRAIDLVVDVQNGLPFFSPLVRRRPVLVLLHHVHHEQWQIIYPGWRGRLGWWLESRVSPWLYRGHRYVTVSHASRADMAATLGVSSERVDIVHNGIDIPHPTQAFPRNPNPTVCVLGRLVPHKQVEHVLAAAAELRASLPTLRVEVVGEGWWHESLREYADAAGVSDMVTFHGHVSDERRGELLDRSWLLLAPSVKEGWGIAIMEAAARAVPAIAYRTAGGVTESIVDGFTGRLVDDQDALVKVADELLRDDEMRTRLGDAARERAAQFGWSRAVRAFESIVGSTSGSNSDGSAQRLP